MKRPKAQSTHYDTLKIVRDAPPEVISAAYRSLAKIYHPDRNHGCQNSAVAMVSINEAFEVLSDPEHRRAYDQWIATQEVPSAEPRIPSRTSPASVPARGLLKRLIRSTDFWFWLLLAPFLILALGFPDQFRWLVQSVKKLIGH